VATEVNAYESTFLMEKEVDVSSPARLKQVLRRQKIIDVLFMNVTLMAALCVLGLLIAIVAALYVGAEPAIKTFGWKFFVTSEWNPVTSQFGALVPIYGTVVTSTIALLIAVPLSFGIALFLTEISPPYLRAPLGIAMELLAAIPSIIYGMWGLFVFAPFFAKNIQPWIQDRFGNLPVIGNLFQGPPMGIGILTAGFVLAIMIIPFISAVMRDTFLVVPGMLKESAYGLGATKWEVAWRVVLPHTKMGVVGGIMLGLARALGETMAVTFVIGNAHELTSSLFMPGNTISSALANEFTEAVGDLYTSSLIELGLILFLITFIVLSCAKLLLRHLKKKEGTLV
jgi:phosphate transport system permease protein